VDPLIRTQFDRLGRRQLNRRLPLSRDSGSSSGDGDSSNAPAKPEPGTVHLSKSDVPKGEWPLTVPEGTVRCDGSGGIGAVTFQTPSGDVYGVNGTALSQGLPRIDRIWRKNPDIPGTRINISPVLDKGLFLCK
jgi:hypothetical protein